MRRIGSLAASALFLAFSAGLSADVDLEIASVKRTHREHITKSPHTFTVDVDAEDVGPMSKLSVVDDILQWVSLEGPAVKAKLSVAGMPDLSSAEALLGSILRPDMTDAEKALAIYTVVARFSDYTSPPRTTWGQNDPIIALNCIQGICGSFTVWANALARKAGLPARTYEITGHTVPEFFYDGRWHMFDPTTRTFFIGNDNRSVASVRELEENLDLIRRTAARERTLNWYATAEDNYLGGHNGKTGWQMDVTLRPGETLLRRTTADGPSLWDYEINRRKKYASGSLVFKPDLARQPLDGFLSTHANIAQNTKGGPVLRPQGPQAPAHAAFTVNSPYPITRATLKGRFGKASAGSSLRVTITARAPGMTTWPREVLAVQETGIREQTVDLTPFVFGAYAYEVRFEMTSVRAGEPTGIESVAFENALHLNAYALPHLRGGKNRITYTDDGADRNVTVVFNFEEKHPVTTRPFPPMANRDNVLRAVVHNRGDEPAENVEVEFKVPYGRTPFTATTTIARIAPGGIATAEVPWKPTRPWRTWIRATADPKNLIKETDEKNNAYNRGFKLVSQPDLSVGPSQLTLEKRGNRAHLEALIINTGGLPARDVPVTFLTGDGKTGKPLGGATVPVVHNSTFTTDEISPYAWATLDTDASKLSGTHVGVTVDAEGKTDDGNRENNTAWVKVSEATRRTPPGGSETPEVLMFFSFEPRKGELRNIERPGLKTAEQVTEHATEGDQSVRVTYPARQWSALRIPCDERAARLPRRIDAYELLRLDVFNDDANEAELVVRFRSLRTGQECSENEASFRLPVRRALTLEVPLGRLTGANLRAVERLELIMDRPNRDVTLYVDNIRLLRRSVPEKLPLLSAETLKAQTQKLGSDTREAPPLMLADPGDLRFFTGGGQAGISGDFNSPNSKQGAKIPFRREESVGLTLQLTRQDSPWPTDWTGFHRLRFHAKGDARMPFGVSIKLRSSHPERGVKYASDNFRLLPNGAEYTVELSEVADRIDLDHMTHLTWFVWRPQFAGTLWLGGLRLEK